MLRLFLVFSLFFCISTPAQDEMAGVGSGISEDLISLEIASPDVPDLTLIDLPGIARVAVKGTASKYWGPGIASVLNKPF